MRFSNVVVRGLGVCCLVLVSHLVHARDIYVDNLLGDDRARGDSATTESAGNGPLRTLNAAIRMARKYDRIIVANTGEPYREVLSLSGAKAGGNVVSPFIIEGNGATLDGTRPVEFEWWSHYDGDVFRYQPKAITFPLLFLDDQPAERIEADDSQPAPPALEPLQWCQYRKFVYFRIEPRKMIEDYRLSAPAFDVGITLYKIQHVVITDLVVQGFRLDGVNANEGVRACLLWGLTCRGNGRSGIAVAGTSRVNIRASLLGDNGQGPNSTDSAQLLATEYSSTLLEDCELLPRAAPALLKVGAHTQVEVTTSPAAPAAEAEKPAE